MAESSAEELPRRELQDESAAALLELVKKKQNDKEDVIGSAEAGSREAEPVDVSGALKRAWRRTGRPEQAPAQNPGCRTPARPPFAGHRLPPRLGTRQKTRVPERAGCEALECGSLLPLS